MDTEKTIVCAYVRVSTDKEDQNNSFENQKLYIDGICNNEKNNYKLYKIYADKGITGTSLNKRDDFNNMLFDAGIDVTDDEGELIFKVSKKRKPKFQRILVKNSSRFARNMESIVIINRLKKAGVYIDFLDLRLTSEKDQDQYIINFFLNFDEQDSKDKSKKVLTGMEISAERGVIHTNKRIYGYNYIPEKNELIPIKEEADVIRMIYDMYVNQGLGIRRIINKLDEIGIKTRESKSFSKSTILRILSNEKYCGDLVRNKWSNGLVFAKHSPKVRPKDEWIIKPDVITAIVSKEMFNIAQKIRESKATDQKGINKGTSEFAGLIKCEQCGANYTRNKDRGRVFYNCGTKKTKGSNACNSCNVTEQELNDLIQALGDRWINLLTVANRDRTIEQLNSLKEQISGKYSEDSQKLVDEKSNEINKLEDQKKKLDPLLMNGIIDIEELNARASEFNEQIRILQKEIDILSMDNNQIETELQEIDDTIRQLLEFKVKDKYSRQEVFDMLEDITVEAPNPETRTFVLYANFKIYSKTTKIIEKYKDEIYVSSIAALTSEIHVPRNFVIE